MYELCTSRSHIGCGFSEADQWLLLFCLQGLNRAASALAHSEKSFRTVQYILRESALFFIFYFYFVLFEHNLTELSWRNEKANVSCMNNLTAHLSYGENFNTLEHYKTSVTRSRVMQQQFSLI